MRFGAAYLVLMAPGTLAGCGSPAPDLPAAVVSGDPVSPGTAFPESVAPADTRAPIVRAEEPGPTSEPVAAAEASTAPAAPRPATGGGGGGGGGGSGGGGPGLPSARPGLTLDVGVQSRDTWRLWPPLARARFAFAAARVGSRLLAVGGEPRESAESVTLSPDGPGPWTLNAAAVAYPDVELAAHGTDGSFLYTLGREGFHRLSLSGASPGATPSVLVRAGAGAFDALRNRLYVFGGRIAGGTLTGTTQYLAISSNFSSAGTGAAAPAAFAGAAAAILGDQAWVVGGYVVDGTTEASGTDIVRRYALATDAWRSSDDGLPAAPPALPEARHSARLVALDDTLYLIGGVGPDGRPAQTVWALTPGQASPAWRAATRLPTPRALPAALAVDGLLVTLGGLDASGQAVTTVEVYKP